MPPAALIKRGERGSPMTKKTVVIVKDDKNAALMLAAALSAAGYRAVCADSIASAARLVKWRHPDLIVLDLSPKDGSGLEFCRKIRADRRLSGAPVLILAGTSKLKYKKRGLLTGEEPYPLNEFVARVSSILRRFELTKDGKGLFSGVKLKINTEAQIVYCGGSIIGDLTKREFDLLVALVKKSPRILSRKYILSSVWHTVAVPNLVDTHIFNIRKKVPRELADKIQSVPGKGFRYFKP